MLHRIKAELWIFEHEFNELILTQPSTFFTSAILGNTRPHQGKYKSWPTVTKNICCSKSIYTLTPTNAALRLHGQGACLVGEMEMCSWFSIERERSKIKNILPTTNLFWLYDQVCVISWVRIVLAEFSIKIFFYRSYENPRHELQLALFWITKEKCENFADVMRKFCILLCHNIYHIICANTLFSPNNLQFGNRKNSRNCVTPKISKAYFCYSIFDIFTTRTCTWHTNFTKAQKRIGKWKLEFMNNEYQFGKYEMSSCCKKTLLNPFLTLVFGKHLYFPQFLYDMNKKGI